MAGSEPSGSAVSSCTLIIANIFFTIAKYFHLQEVDPAPGAGVPGPCPPHPQREDAGVQQVVAAELAGVQPHPAPAQEVTLRGVQTSRGRGGTRGAQRHAARGARRDGGCRGQGYEALQAEGRGDGGRRHHQGRVSDDQLEGGDVPRGHQVAAPPRLRPQGEGLAVAGVR